MRSFLVFFMCFFWVTALLTPSLLILAEDTGSYVVQTVHEEEPEEDSEQELELTFQNEGARAKSRIVELPYIEPARSAQTGLTSLLQAEILLPPPKDC